MSTIRNRILDSLPVAVRNDQYNYISRGFPVGFVTPPNYKEVRDSGRAVSCPSRIRLYVFTYMPLPPHERPTDRPNAAQPPHARTSTHTRTQPNVHCIYNHMRIIVKYNEDPSRFQGSRVVGFEVVPFSVKHQWDSHNGATAFDPQATVLETCNDERLVKYEGEGFQSVEGPGEVIYTYDIEWKESDTPWAHRWDVYFTGNPDDEVLKGLMMLQ